MQFRLVPFVSRSYGPSKVSSAILGLGRTTSAQMYMICLPWQRRFLTDFRPVLYEIAWIASGPLFLVGLLGPGYFGIGRNGMLENDSNDQMVDKKTDRPTRERWTSRDLKMKIEPVERDMQRRMALEMERKGIFNVANILRKNR